MVAVTAVADHPQFAVFIDELEEDGKQAEAAFVHDGGAAENNGVEFFFACKEDLFAFQLGLAVNFDRIGFFVFCNGLVEVLGPQAVGRSKDEFVHIVTDAGVCDDFGAVYIGCPQVVDSLAVVGEHGGQVENGVELVIAEDFFDLFLVADIAQDACQVLVLVGIGAKVDAHALMTLREEFFL